LGSVQLKAALQEAFSLAQRTNQYISEREPWKLVKTNTARARSVIYTGLQLVDYLKVLLCPFLPFTCQRLHEMLGYAGTLAPQPVLGEGLDPDGMARPVLTGDYETTPRWKPTPVPIGQAVHAPSILFTKLEPEQSDL
jgi:methionyl-tRNA synthetase